MRIFKKLNGAALLFAVLLFTACDKEKAPENSIVPAAPAAQTNQKTCRLTKLINDDFYEEYTYDNSGNVTKVSRFDADDKCKWVYAYTYNAAGKVAERKLFTPDSSLPGKTGYTYNAKNLLTRADFYGDSSVSGNQPQGYILYQYNSAGQRILAQEYWGKPAVLVGYSQFTYNPTHVLKMDYDARTTPATLRYSEEIYYDNMKSVYSALGYLDEFYPEKDKHNIIRTRWATAPFSGWESSSSSYEYDSLGYPIKSMDMGNVGWISFTRYEYDCQ
jgi:YD repeat-containing protein